MIKISALNKDSDEETRSEEEVTKEAVEQIALQQYAKALELHRNGSIADATQLLKDLLETELLDGVRKPAPGEKVTTPLFNLKYLCYKNLASMLGAAGELAAGIDAYTAAAALDDTDITLWHRLGVLCMRARRYDEALAAFQRGVQLRPQHWPCLDRLVTLLLGLHCLEDCVELCYQTLELDPGYLRALTYRRHIYQNYPYVRDYMEYVSPKYKWDKNIKEEIDEVGAEPLLAEALEIREYYTQLQKADVFKHSLPDLQMKVPALTWLSVGSALVEMHHYMTNNYFSHACRIKVHCDDEDLEAEPMEVSQEPETPVQQESPAEDRPECEVNATDADNADISISDRDKSVNESSPEKVDGEAEPMTPATCGEEPSTAADARKKPPTRRRGSAVGLLQQWEWYYKRQPRRKQAAAAARPDRFDHTVYHMLRSILPPSLMHTDQPDVTTPTPAAADPTPTPQTPHDEYFRSPNERADVKQFVVKYAQPKRDIIDILKDYLYILARKWKLKWPAGLAAAFVEANRCYSTHVDAPQPCAVDHYLDELRHHTAVTLLAEELAVNAKMRAQHPDTDTDTPHDPAVIESLGMILTFNPHKFESPFTILELFIRYLWVRAHICLLNKDDKMALEYLSRLALEFYGMEDSCDTYQLEISNFTFKSIVNIKEIQAYCNLLERNEKLASVLELYNDGWYHEALCILINSFDYCKEMSRQEEEDISLDFATQLVVLVDCWWQERRYENCFKWSLVCLHEALKHYFRHTSGSPEYDKWSRTVVKILTVMERVLTTYNLMYLETVTQSELGQGVEDLIRIMGHQIEAAGADMPLGTVSPWIIMHFILQREEDQGRGRVANEPDEVPDPVMILFLGHEQLGERGWCCQSDAKLIFFIMDSVVSRLRAPALTRCRQYMAEHLEQCVYCLYGHPGRKNKVKYLAEHNVTPRTLDWERAQQVYEIFRPAELPALEGKSGITADTEQLLHRIIDLLPTECDPQQHVSNVGKYIRGVDNKLSTPAVSLPFKMRDIYFLLGDYYFKKEEHKLAIKYNMLDVTINKDRLESWAEISLAKAVNLQRLLNSCKNIDNEKEFLNPAKSIIRCFKRTLQLDPTHCNMLIEYGMFVYAVHSFCSRLLKQASESLSMDDFESLERQKEDMLHTTHKCFKAVLKDMQSTAHNDDNEDAWLHFYMLGKVAEKRNRPPAEYLHYYMQGVRSLHEANASYPHKINYCSPVNQCIQVLELHYRIHATILKYIEQHENKPIPSSVGKVFTACIDEWKNGPFVNKKVKKQTPSEQESESKADSTVQAGNIQKRSVSDTGEADYPDAKRTKTEASAAKIKRSVSYDPESLAKAAVEPKTTPLSEATPSSEAMAAPSSEAKATTTSEATPSSEAKATPSSEAKATPSSEAKATTTSEATPSSEAKATTSSEAKATPSSEAKATTSSEAKATPSSEATSEAKATTSSEAKATPSSEAKATTSSEAKASTSSESDKPTVTLPSIGEDDVFEARERAPSVAIQINLIDTTKATADNNKPQGRKKSDSTSSSSSSSSGSSSSSSSSSSSASSASCAAADPPLTPAQRADIAAACLDALEDCACRFPPHYKAIYRLAHYHFYYSKGKDIERCRDLMLSNFKSSSGQRLSGLFGERKPSNFFNNIWKIPMEEVDRAGGFAFHMSRCVLLSMEILKEIDDHKTLLDLSLHLQRIPQADKKYLRDSDREELAQQALSLCLQSLKGQLLKFSQQADLKSNEVERNVFDTMMLDIYRYYQRTQKQPSAKQFTSLLVDAYKLIKPTSIPETANLVDLSMKYCQALIQTLKQQAAQASRERSQNAQRKQTAKAAVAAPTQGIKRKASPSPPVKATTPTTTAVKALAPPLPPPAPPARKAAPQASKISRPASQHPPPHAKSEFKTPSAPAPPGTAALAAALHNYLPMLNAASPSSALSYLSNMSALHGYTQSLQASLQSTLQNSFEAEFYRQLLTQSLSSFNAQPQPPPVKKQKRGPNPKKVTQVPPAGAPPKVPPAGAPPKPNKPAVSGSQSSKLAMCNVTKQPTSAPSMGTVLSTLPPSMASLSFASGARPAGGPVPSTGVHSSPPAHEKTLQQKLAERQKSSQSVASATTSSLKAVRRKKSDASKALPFSNPDQKPSTSDEIIVLDDD